MGGERRRAGETRGNRVVASEMTLFMGFAASLLRMILGYIVAFIFSVVYGAKAAQSPRNERWMIPLLDLLQSIPILGFFPVAIFVLMRLTGGGRFSAELASIFLIFTSMAWNMAFSVFQSIRGIPRPLLEMAAVFQVRQPWRFLNIIYPACIPGLVFNSMVSWASGWYFLVASEIIAVGPVKVELPGLGAYLMKAVERGDFGGAVGAVVLLSAFTLGMEAVVWRPLRTWSQRFKMEEIGSDEIREGSRMVIYYRQARWFQFVRGLLSRIGIWGVRAGLNVNRRLSQWTGLAVKYRVGWVLLVLGVVWAMYALVGSGGARVLIPPEWKMLLVFSGLSLMRIVAAYLLALAWTVPFSLRASRSRWCLSVATVISQIGASIPATALFPFLVFVLRRVRGGPELASIILIMTGMQWYLLFNLLAGTQAVPQDLKEMATIFGIGWRLYTRAILRPTVFPYFVTGSITGWGGAWNALIVSEYVVFEGKEYVLPGIGAYLSRSAFESGNLPGLFTGLALMSVMVLVLNRLVWKPLERKAAEKYRVES